MTQLWHGKLPLETLKFKLWNWKLQRTHQYQLKFALTRQEIKVVEMTFRSLNLTFQSERQLSLAQINVSQFECSRWTFYLLPPKSGTLDRTERILMILRNVSACLTADYEVSSSNWRLCQKVSGYIREPKILRDRKYQIYKWNANRHCYWVMRHCSFVNRKSKHCGQFRITVSARRRAVKYGKLFGETKKIFWSESLDDL